jgi:glutathione S-transferase
MDLYAHPFSSFCQKALIGFYENDLAFDWKVLGPDPAIQAEWARLWPARRMPLLVDEGRVVMEATAILEHLAVHHPGRVKLIPDDPALAAEARMMDRVFDLYVSVPQQKFVFDILRAETDRDPFGVGEARTLLDRIYPWLDQRMQGREWAAGDDFTLADCAAAPALFYADWTHPIDARFSALRAYRTRLLARPSFARCVEEARPWRHYFPLGAPDRD